MKLLSIWLLQLFFAPSVYSDCRLKPISFGYYFGVTQKSFKEAQSCCESKGMTLASLKNKKQRENIPAALLSDSFLSEPIGPANGVYITTNPKNNQRYYPKSFEQLEQESRSRNAKSYLTKPKELSICSIVYLFSPKNTNLKVAGMPCELANRYLCQRIKKYDSSVYLKLNYTELIEDTYLYCNSQHDWREARDCCEEKGGELYRFTSNSDNEDLYTALIDNAILQRENETGVSFWTGGFKKVDKSPFVWSNFDQVLITEGDNAEFCLRSTAQGNDIKLGNHPCENQLHFICRIKVPQKCHLVNMQPLTMKNTFRTYYYSRTYKLTWSEAVLCCRERGFELLSVVSPQEGNVISAYFQTSSEYRYRHQGYPYGIWTSGRQHKNGVYEFVSVRTETLMKKSGDNHFMEGTETLNGTCLQYIVDARNSYFLNNILCKSIRSFICEQPEVLTKYSGLGFREMGNKYFYSDSKSGWSDADEACKLHGMSLLNLKNFEENKAKKENQKNYKEVSRRKPRRGFNRARIQLTTTTAKPNTTNLHNCTSTYLENDQIRIASSNDCGQQLGYICEKQDSSYGLCDSTLFTAFGRYLFNPKSTIWSEARKCCAGLGQTLINLSDPQKRSVVYDLLKNTDYHLPQIGVWTSGTNLILPDKWIWAGTHQFLDTDDFYNNYKYYDETTRVGDDHQCLEAFANRPTKQLVLDHEDCDIPKPFLCDNPDVISPKQCEKIRFERLRRTRFYYALRKIQWAHAQECCLERGMTLAEISDAAASEKLNQFVAERSDGAIHKNPNFGFWIGLTSHVSNHSSFTWIDSLKTVQSLNYSSWNPVLQTPISPKESCVQAYTDVRQLQWKNVDCLLHLRFLCQLKKK